MTLFLLAIVTGDKMGKILKIDVANGKSTFIAMDDPLSIAQFCVSYKNHPIAVAGLEGMKYWAAATYITNPNSNTKQLFKDTVYPIHMDIGSSVSSFANTAWTGGSSFTLPNFGNKTEWWLFSLDPYAICSWYVAWFNSADYVHNRFGGTWADASIARKAVIDGDVICSTKVRQAFIDIDEKKQVFHPYLRLARCCERLIVNGFSGEKPKLSDLDKFNNKLFACGNVITGAIIGLAATIATWNPVLGATISVVAAKGLKAAQNHDIIGAVAALAQGAAAFGLSPADIPIPANIPKGLAKNINTLRKRAKELKDEMKEKYSSELEYVTTELGVSYSDAKDAYYKAMNLPVVDAKYYTDENGETVDTTDNDTGNKDGLVVTKVDTVTGSNGKEIKVYHVKQPIGANGKVEAGQESYVTGKDGKQIKVKIVTNPDKTSNADYVAIDAESGGNDLLVIGGLIAASLLL